MMEKAWKYYDIGDHIPPGWFELSTGLLKTPVIVNVKYISYTVTVGKWYKRTKIVFYHPFMHLCDEIIVRESETYVKARIAVARREI